MGQDREEVRVARMTCTLDPEDIHNRVTSKTTPVENEAPLGVTTSREVAFLEKTNTYSERQGSSTQDGLLQFHSRFAIRVFCELRPHVLVFYQGCAFSLLKNRFFDEIHRLFDQGYGISRGDVTTVISARATVEVSPFV